MVNLPPDQNERRDRDGILSFDELLAVVLALLGIGSVLWWGMTRSSNRLFDAINPLGPGTPEVGQLEGSRSADERAALDDGATGLFEPRLLPAQEGSGTLETDRVIERDQGLSGLNPATEGVEGAPQTVTPAVVPVPVERPETPPVETAETAPPPLDITDVPQNYWAYPFIKAMYDQGYLPDLPTGQFQPDREVTRAELAALLNEVFADEPTVAGPQQFGDVSNNYWAAPAIDRVVQRGFMSGYPENDFRPDQPVPRYQVLITLASGLNLADSPNTDATLQQFIDADSLPVWARPKVAAAANQGLVVNYPNPDQLKPTEAATRAEIVTLMHQALVAQGKLNPVESPYIVPSGQ